MLLRPRSQQMLKQFYNQQNNQLLQNTNQIRKKIENFSFLPNDKIGKGYSSIVYKGINDITNQPVAIKVIDLKSLKDQNTKKFLQNQLQCLRKLFHKNCLKYINSFMTANNCYIITQLYQLGDLSKQLKKVKNFQEKNLFKIFQQFYNGYCHFFTQGFIHRDIKPSNILVSKRININTNQYEYQYCIADFGFVKKTSEHPKDPFNVGTPVYMSPESISSNIYTEKSDIWSMGIMIFQLMYGFLPFHSRSQQQLKKDICNRQIKLNLIEENTKIYASSQFKMFLMSCLRKNPENRINLFDIKQHVWFKKFNKEQNKNKCQINNNLNHNNNKLKIMDFIKNTNSDQHQKTFINTFVINKNQQSDELVNLNDSSNQNFGYIGNQAIKRQRSLQGGGCFSLKNYYKNPQKKLTLKTKSTLKFDNYSNEKDKQNISLNLNSIKQKFKALDQKVDIAKDKFNSLNFLKSQQSQQSTFINTNRMLNSIKNNYNQIFQPTVLVIDKDKSFNMGINNSYENKILENKLKYVQQSPNTYQRKIKNVLNQTEQNNIKNFNSNNHYKQNKIITKTNNYLILDVNNDRKINYNNLPKTQNNFQISNKQNIPSPQTLIALNRQVINSQNSLILQKPLIQSMKNIVNLKNDHVNRVKQLSKRKNFPSNNNSITQKFDSIKKSLQQSKRQIKLSCQKFYNLNNNETFRNRNTFSGNRNKQENYRNNYSLLSNREKCVDISQSNTQNSSKLQAKSKINTFLSISNHQFLIRTLHLLRFFNQVISIKAQKNQQELQQIQQSKQQIYKFFAILLNKLAKTVSCFKENSFKLQKWFEFINQDKFKTFQQVVHKYKQRFTSNKKIQEHFRKAGYQAQYQFYSLKEKKYIQDIQIRLLKKVQLLTHNMSKNDSKTQNNNSLIRLIYYLHKSLQILSFIAQSNEKHYLDKNNPSQLIDLINSKTKDPFKIPKMIIQLKKRLMLIEAYKQNQDKQIIFQKIRC